MWLWVMVQDVEWRALVHGCQGGTRPLARAGGQAGVDHLHAAGCKALLDLRELSHDTGPRPHCFLPATTVTLSVPLNGVASHYPHLLFLDASFYKRCSIRGGHS